MNQLIELNIEIFNIKKPIQILGPWNFTNFKNRHSPRLTYSYRYRQLRPTDKLIMFINNEYEKILSNIMIDLIFRTQDVFGSNNVIKFTEDQIEIILNNQLNLNV